jgi:prepilin-type N-terminal cleavage/methylation domain-containing protein
MRKRNSSRRPAFTLVEMLVVIGIIVVLVALLVPVGAIAIARTRDFNMSAEISQLAQAIDTYKKEKGDYPPSMGEIDANGNSLYLSSPYTSVCEKHLRKCFPHITPAEKAVFYQYLAPQMTQSEALWFWLSQTQNDERQPFFSTAGNYKKYFDFKPDRVVPTKSVTIVINGSNVPFQLNAYKPTFAKETPYVYLDSRTYFVHGDITRAAPYSPVSGEIGQVQAYFDDKPNPKAMNFTTFQIICAGQDGEFGAPLDQIDNSGNVITAALKQFKSGFNYTDDDKDNLTNFSEGRRLGDHIP